MMAFNETFGDRIINLSNSPDGDSRVFLYFMSFKSQKGSLLLVFTG